MEIEAEMSQYEAAIKWIEDEVLRHGVFDVRSSMGDSYNHELKSTSQVPTGRLDGFTVSSQHVRGALNLLQLINEMKRAKNKRQK